MPTSGSSTGTVATDTPVGPFATHTHHKIVRGAVGHSLKVPVSACNDSGTHLTTGTVTATIIEQFGEYTATEIESMGATWHDPPIGTTTEPDPRWRPSIDGEAGFNLELVIPHTLITKYGTYRVDVTIVSGGKNYKITLELHIGSNLTTS